MHCSAAPAVLPPAGPATSPLRLALTRAEQLEFGDGTPYPRAYRERYVDVLGLYGMRPETAGGPQQGRNSFTDMALAALGRLGPAERQADLVIIAHATPDAEPGWAACTLSERLAQAPLAFAVSDQGSAAPFTALRVADAYVRTGAHRRCLLLLLDQKTVARPAPGAVPLEDSAVALIIDAAGDGRAGGALSLWQCTGLGPADVGQAVRDVLPRLLPAAGPGQTIVVHGPGLDGWAALLPPGSRRARAGLPCTGLWAEFAALARAGGPRSRVLLADYDPVLRYLCLCAVGSAQPHEEA
jgi:hypothetical protein